MPQDSEGFDRDYNRLGQNWAGIWLVRWVFRGFVWISELGTLSLEIDLGCWAT